MNETKEESLEVDSAEKPPFLFSFGVKKWCGYERSVAYQENLTCYGATAVKSGSLIALMQGSERLFSSGKPADLNIASHCRPPP